MYTSASLISISPGLRSTIIAFSSWWHGDGLTRLPTTSHKPVMYALSGMSSRSSMGKLARVQTPRLPMKITQRLRLISDSVAPGTDQMRFAD